MIFGDCPYCDEPVMLNVPEGIMMPVYGIVVCPNKHQFVEKFSRIDPQAFRMEEVIIDKENRTIQLIRQDRVKIVYAHPEDYCHRCGGANISWSAPSPLWNEVMRGGDIEGEWLYDEIICPTCFAVIAKEKGIATLFRFYAEDISVELKTVTPSGRIWNEETWLWEEPKDTYQKGLEHGKQAER